MQCCVGIMFSNVNFNSLLRCMNQDFDDRLRTGKMSLAILYPGLARNQ